MRKERERKGMIQDGEEEVWDEKEVGEERVKERMWMREEGGEHVTRKNGGVREGEQVGVGGVRKRERLGQTDIEKKKKKKKEKGGLVSRQTDGRRDGQFV
ncbi:Hypothetical predicted protein [Xyrichtys novacula]|uniref:Uncharacterized protein n=1 Tax=Xyrichtys novacula TaxID=13765 RepID=A0AAV1H968_XYRNO|nr:Hypothetical predicted protein [Xyrichtys novacula]